jgi:hypothetical protein
MATTTCKSCQLAIPAGESTCPYCGGKADNGRVGPILAIMTLPIGAAVILRLFWPR